MGEYKTGYKYEFSIIKHWEKSKMRNKRINTIIFYESLLWLVKMVYISLDIVYEKPWRYVKVY